MALFERDLECDTTIKPRSKEYRLLCLKKIETSWPGLWELRLDEITAQACKDWSAELSKEISSHYFNGPPVKCSPRLKITVPSESWTFHSVRWR